MPVDLGDYVRGAKVFESSPHRLMHPAQWVTGVVVGVFPYVVGVHIVRTETGEEVLVGHSHRCPLPPTPPTPQRGPKPGDSSASPPHPLP